MRWLICNVLCVPTDRERQRRADYASGAVQERTDQRGQGTMHSLHTGVRSQYGTRVLCISIDMLAVKHESVNQ